MVQSFFCECYIPYKYKKSIVPKISPGGAGSIVSSRSIIIYIYIYIFHEDVSRPFWARNDTGETSRGETYRSRNVRIPNITLVEHRISRLVPNRPCRVELSFLAFCLSGEITVLRLYGSDYTKYVKREKIISL